MRKVFNLSGSSCPIYANLIHLTIKPYAHLRHVLYNHGNTYKLCSTPRYFMMCTRFDEPNLSAVLFFFCPPIMYLLPLCSIQVKCMSTDVWITVMNRQARQYCNNTTFNCSTIVGQCHSGPWIGADEAVKNHSRDGCWQNCAWASSSLIFLFKRHIAVLLTGLFTLWNNLTLH